MATLVLESKFDSIPPGKVYELVQGDQKLLGIALSDLALPASMLDPAANLSFVCRAGFYLVSAAISADRSKVELKDFQRPDPPVSQRTLGTTATATGVDLHIPQDLFPQQIAIGAVHSAPLVLCWVEVRDSATTPETIANRAVRLLIRRGPLSGS